MRKRTKITLDPKYILMAIAIVCVVLIIISFRFQDKMTPIRTAVGSVVTPMQRGINKIGLVVADGMEYASTVKKLTKENDNLQKQVDELSSQNRLLQQDKYDLDNFRKLYDLDEKYKDVKESDAIESSDSPVFQKRMEVVHRLARLYEDTGAQLDAIFGPHTCDKVFGADVTPDEAMVSDFLDQLTPIMQKIADERGEKIRLRYSRSRGRHS